MVQVSPQYLSYLEARVSALREGGNETLIPSPSGLSPSSNEDNAFEDIHNPLEENLAQLSTSPWGKRRYLGTSSSTSFGLRFHNMVRAFRPKDGEFALPTEHQTCSDTAWPTKQRPASPTLPLPPYEHAKQLYAAQHAYIGTIFSFLSPAVFFNNLDDIYFKSLDLSDRESCLVYCQVLLMLAYGQMYSINQWTGNDGPPGFSYFIQALQCLPDIHEEGSVLFVEVLSLIGYFMQNLNRRDAAFLYTGLALRMAISLGLHQEVADSTLDDMEREHRRRLWWSVYSMDRILCAKSGNPLAIADGDIGVHQPSRMPAIETETSPVTVLYHYTKLSSILGKIMENVYRKPRKSSPNLVGSVHTIMADLALWLSNLPPPLRLDFHNLDNNNISRESVSMYLHYYQCINLTARPLLLYVVQKRLQEQSHTGAISTTNWREGLSQSTATVIEACISAARDATTILVAAAKKNLVATYGFMDGDDAFSAALILVIVDIALPHTSREHEAMTQALEVLRVMANRGNKDIHARRQSLLDLQIMFNRAQSTTLTTTATATPSFEPCLDPLLSVSGQDRAQEDVFPGCADVSAADNGASCSGNAEDSGTSSGMAGLFPSLQPGTDLSQLYLDLDATTDDMSLWEEVYGNIDARLDFENETTRIARQYSEN